MFTCTVYVSDVSPPYLKSEISTLYNSPSLFFLFSPNNKFSKKNLFCSLAFCKIVNFSDLGICMGV